MMIIACIPAYNEGKTIKKIVDEVTKYVDKVIVCNDGSSDNTKTQAESTGAIVINHKENFGKGIAMKNLFLKAKEYEPTAVVTIDGDGQFKLEDIPNILNPIINEDADIVIGNRYSNAEEMPRYRKFGNKVLDKMTNLASELPFEDTQSGFRGYSSNALEKIQFFSKRYSVESEILIDASKKNLKITEVPISVIYKTGNKTSNANPISHSAGIMVSLLEKIAVNHPLRYLGIPGLIMIIVGTIFSIIVISIFNDTRYFSIPSTLIALGMLIIGVLFVLSSVLLFAVKKQFEGKNND